MFAERIKSFANDVLHFGAGNMLYSIVQFVTMPLVVRNIDKEQVADWNILLPTGVLLAAFVTFGMDSATVRHLKDAEDDEQRSAIFSTGFLFELIVAVLLGGCLVLASGRITVALHLSDSQTASWIVLMGWLPGVILAQYFQNWFKYTFRRSLFIRLLAIQAGVYLSGIVFLALSSHLTLFNVMLVMLLSQWLAAFTGLFLCRRLLAFQIDIPLLKLLLGYGLPFMVFAFGYNFIVSLDRYMLAGNLSKEEFAVYTQAVRISAIVTMVVSSFNFAFGPFSLSLLGKSDAEKTFSRFHTYYIITMFFVGLSFLAFGKVIISIFAGTDYLDGYGFFLPFVAGYILYGLYSFAQLGIIHSKKSHLSLYVLAVGAATCIVTNFMLVERYGGYGTAIGFLLANLMMVLVSNILSAKFLRIEYNLVKDTILMLLFVAVGYGFVQVSFTESIVLDGTLKFVSLLLVLPLVFFLFLADQERDYLRRVVFRNPTID
ncbi:MAG: oligosaccharide flippase family protein [Blastocatellia bacterium]|nr:oligosaccharide flippase family protein [Blastocatellia bacterium]